MLNVSYGSATLMFSNNVPRCCKADEEHHKRHQEIIRTIRKLEKLEGRETSETLAAFAQKERRLSKSASCSSSDVSSDKPESLGPKPTKKERKRDKKDKAIAVYKSNHIESFTREEFDLVSEAIHGSVNKGKGAWVFKRQESVEYLTKMTPSNTVSTSSREIFQLSLKEKKRMGSKPTNTPQKSAKAIQFNPTIDPYGDFDLQIHSKLHVKIIKLGEDTATRKDIINQLSAQITEDLHIAEMDQRERRMREEGFKRWAGRECLKKMAVSRREVDWTTGQRYDKHFTAFLQQTDLDDVVDDDDAPAVDGTVDDHTLKADSVVSID